MAIYDKLTYPFGRIFRLKKNLSDERSIKNNYNRIDLTTAARFSYDINYRRYKYADYMMQLHYPYHQTTFKCLLQLTPIMDTLYLPADQARYGEVCASLKVPIFGHEKSE